MALRADLTTAFTFNWLRNEQALWASSASISL